MLQQHFEEIHLLKKSENLFARRTLNRFLERDFATCILNPHFNITQAFSLSGFFLYPTWGVALTKTSSRAPAGAQFEKR
jgi:hypothetical protein